MKVVLVSLLIIGAPALFAQPLLTMEKIFTQLDTTASGIQGTKQLEFTNMGNKALTITGVITGFDDEKVSFPKKTIAPGKTGIITYSYTKTECGKFNRDITIHSDGGEQIVHLKGYVSCPIPKEDLGQ